MQQPMSLRELLAIFSGPCREEMLMLIDPGQRGHVETEFVALASDVPSSKMTSKLQPL